MDPPAGRIPQLKDLTSENITENTIRINSQAEDLRLTYIFERLVSHLHDFARETRLSSKEWMAGIEFLTATGHICSDVRQEFILLSDVLGLSLLVDSIDHPKPPRSTEGSVLGPFHSDDAEDMTHGGFVSHDPSGEPCLVLCHVRDSHGYPIEGVKIDIWETDSSGHYDVQYEGREKPDGRCVMRSDAEGQFWFKTIKPVPYPIPHDGPVGKLLSKLNRHCYRPAHIHFMFEKPGYDHLITALYIRNDPYESSDAVFGVKESLLVDFRPAGSRLADLYGVDPSTATLEYDFVLVSEAEVENLRNEKSKNALADLGKEMRLINGLPVPEVD